MQGDLFDMEYIYILNLARDLRVGYLENWLIRIFIVTKLDIFRRNQVSEASVRKSYRYLSTIEFNLSFYQL